ncbi:MAG: ABC transporter ATP-binding protein [Pseudomonadota bacterium]
MNSLLNVKNIEVHYQGHRALDDVSFHINQGSLVSILGPSGCGKTTLLRAIAGFESITRGEIDLSHRCISRSGFTLPPEQRRIGMVFQDYALFPHLTVSENVSFGLRGLGKKEKTVIADSMLELVGLAQLGRRYPHELSGGQQQRVALARALAPKPDLILMDEPFSNLDVDLRERLSTEVRDILKHQGITGVLVTHDQNEAFAMADHIGVMQHGQLQQWDTPFNLYHEPANRFVADFIGKGIFLPGVMDSHEAIRTEIGLLQGNRAYPWGQGTEVDILIRPDDIVPNPNSGLRGRITAKAFKGAEILYTLKLETGSTVLSLFPSHMDHELGETVGVDLNLEHIVAFARPQRLSGC